MEQRSYEQIATGVSEVRHSFGGSWTSEKLEALIKYLRAYTTILSKKNFHTTYIDAFAGTGKIATKRRDADLLPFFNDSTDENTERFLVGSARAALQVDPAFNNYIFIEKNKLKCADLETLREQFPERRNNVQIVQDDANSYLQELCARKNWASRRAVLFLDPYGMSVDWRTVEVVARTKAIDMWYLFPIGMGVNRLLKKGGDIPKAWQDKLDRVFGAADWREEFFKPSKQVGLFGDSSEVVKVQGFDKIGEYVLRRLRTIFPWVAQNPLYLSNSKGSPLYLFCFAAGNEKGGQIAVKIARDILGRR